MDDTQYRQYSFARSAAILSLEYAWPQLKTLMDSLFKQLRLTSIEVDDLAILEGALKQFENNCINVVINFYQPLIHQENVKSEHDIFHDIVLTLPEIYYDLFYVFLKNIRSIPSQKSPYPRLPDSLKFRIYNCDLRDRKLKKPATVIDFSECDFDNGNYLSKQDIPRGHLMQGYWQMESMIKELRNHVAHWKKGGRMFLDNELKRKMSDPLSNAPATGNLIILPGILLLMTYNILEVLQTWLDTIHLIK